MSIRTVGQEVTFDSTDWVKTYKGVKFGLELADFGDGNKIVYLWAFLDNQWTVQDAVEISLQLTTPEIDDEMANVLAMVRKWFRKFFASPAVANDPMKRLDIEIKNIRFIEDPLDVRYP
jgi:hypothetical protein